MQIREAQTIPIMMDAKILSPRHIIIKRPNIKDKERLLKAREKMLVTRRLPDGRVDGECVATLQGQAGPWYSCRWKNIHGAVGMSGMPLFMGGRATHTVSCVSVCMSPVMTLAPQCGTHRGIPFHVSHHHRPHQGVPTCLSARGEQSWQDARTVHNLILPMQAHFMGTVYRTQSQGYKNITYHRLVAYLTPPAGT